MSGNIPNEVCTYIIITYSDEYYCGKTIGSMEVKTYPLMVLEGILP